jgi:hypothetical protein
MPERGSRAGALVFVLVVLLVAAAALWLYDRGFRFEL